MLDNLPNTERIPAFFFAHGSPQLLMPPEDVPPSLRGSAGGLNGELSQFLQKFGPFVLNKYKPKAIIVFSAHWESEEEIHVMSRDSPNPLYYDYYGFPKKMYELQFESKGSVSIANKIKDLLVSKNISVTLDTKRGLDHGVFIPFLLMFPSCPIPIIEVSMHSNLNPQKLIELGKTLMPLRDEGYLILSGGLTIHTFEDFSAFNEKTAKPEYKTFHNDLIESVETDSIESLISITKHVHFRKAHPREEHFVPIYIAAGAGIGGKSLIVSKLYGALTVAFGV